MPVREIIPDATEEQILIAAAVLMGDTSCGNSRASARGKTNPRIKDVRTYISGIIQLVRFRCLCPELIFSELTPL